MKNKIVFGFGHVLKATPTIIGRLQKGLNIATIGLIPLIPDIASEFNTSEKKFSLLLSLSTIALNMLAEMFGVKITSPSVPAQDVTEVKTS